MFFISSALYPLWRLIDNGALYIYYAAKLNPFTYGVEMVRAASLGNFYLDGFIVCVVCTLTFLFLAIRGYNPQNNVNKKSTNKNV